MKLRLFVFSLIQNQESKFSASEKNVVFKRNSFYVFQRQDWTHLLSSSSSCHFSLKLLELTVFPVSTSTQCSRPNYRVFIKLTYQDQERNSRVLFLWFLHVFFFYCIHKGRCCTRCPVAVALHHQAQQCVIRISLHVTNLPPKYSRVLFQNSSVGKGMAGQPVSSWTGAGWRRRMFLAGAAGGHIKTAGMEESFEWLSAGSLLKIYLFISRKDKPKSFPW